MGVWESVIAGAIAAGSAYVSSKNAKKQAEGVHDQWEARMRWEEEKVARKRNSMGGKMAPYLMEQMLRVYGDQSKGRGGFTLPIDEMLQNMHIKERQGGSYDSSGYQDSKVAPGMYKVGGTGNYGARGISPEAKSSARKEGINYVMGQVDPEVEGYNGKTWNRADVGNASLEGAPSGGGDWMGTSSAFNVGGPREQTRSNDGGGGRVMVRGARANYNTPNGNMEVSQPDQVGTQTDLASGGTFTSTGREIPPEMVKRFGLGALKVGMSVFVPGLGTVINVAGKIKQKTGHSDGKQSFWETFAGISDKDYGRISKSDSFLGRLFDRINGNKPGQQQVASNNPSSDYGPYF